MNIHEYQAKEVLRAFGVPTGKGIAAFTIDEAVKAAESGLPVQLATWEAGGGAKSLGGVGVTLSDFARSLPCCLTAPWSRTSIAPKSRISFVFPLLTASDPVSIS